MRNKKLQVWLPLIFSLVMIAGMYFGFRLHQQTGSGDGFFKRDKRSSLQEALNIIRTRYVDSIGVDSLKNDAMQGLMNHLDPHSYYIPATELTAANEDITGNFEGIGVEFNIFSDTVHVLYVIPGGPSEKAGLQVGDRILKVAGTPVSGQDVNSESIKKLIRGSGGSTVQLLVQRQRQPMVIKVVRGTIPIPSVDASYMIDSVTGYIRLNKFSETTYREFMQAMERLQKNKLTALVLDLRGNGGGLVTQATHIADEFLDGDKLIVYTEGTNTTKREYHAGKEGVFEKGKLAVLVDELTASASEILAGALQDWDRAQIVGRRSFGKGLVQEQYELSDGSALRLTVARYYTPLGRSIQRPYDKGKKVYLEEIYDRYETGEMLSADSIHINKQKAYKTNGGKTVYAGGGIMPDVYVPIDSSLFIQSVTRLYLDGRFNNFVYQYYTANLPRWQQYKTPADLVASYPYDNEVWNRLVAYAAKDGIDLKNVPLRDRKNIQDRIKAYLARFRWRTQGYYEVANRDDQMVQKALGALRK